MNKNSGCDSRRRRHLQGLLGIAMLLIVQAAVATPAFAVGSDKISHFAGGGATGFAVDTLMYHIAADMGTPKRIGSAFGFSLIPGVIIEIHDKIARDDFGWGDLLADGLGAATGVMAAELINGQFWISASGRQIRLIGRW